MSRHASQATKPMPVPKTAVHPADPLEQPIPMPKSAVHALEVVRRGLFDWWSVAVIAAVVTFAVTMTVLIVV